MRKMTNRTLCGMAAALLLGACASGDPQFEEHPPDQNLSFCETDFVRSDTLVQFSEPLPIASTVEFEISISADFENFETDFEYPDPLVCVLSQEEGERTVSCPDYEPTVEEFTFDSNPKWVFDENGDISGFRWYRIVEAADIRLTQDGEEVFDELVEFEVTTSECPEHVYEDFTDHPEYGESYRYAVGEVDTSE